MYYYNSQANYLTPTQEQLHLYSTILIKKTASSSSSIMALH